MALDLVFVNQTGLPDDQVFITFQRQSTTSGFDVSYGGTAVSFSSSDAIMSNSVDLGTIGAGGMTVGTLVGGIVFVSYGAALTAITTPPSFIGTGGADFDTAFQPFELTMQGLVSVTPAAWRVTNAVRMNVTP